MADYLGNKAAPVPSFSNTRTGSVGAIKAGGFGSSTPANTRPTTGQIFPRGNK